MSQGTRTDLQPVDNINKLKRGGTGASYLARRIARDRPDILERMKAGEFKSVRAAALEAGIVKLRAIRRHPPDIVSAGSGRSEALALWREEMKVGQGARTDIGNNVTEVKERVTGNSRAYTLDRLRRESPVAAMRRTTGDGAALENSPKPVTMILTM